MGAIESFAAQQRSNLASAFAGLSFLKNPQFVSCGKLPALRVGLDFGIRNRS
jgi:hypothetical protein